jgi:hypothetical protein
MRHDSSARVHCSRLRRTLLLVCEWRGMAVGKASVVPIALGYQLAHCFSYLPIQGQFVPLASDLVGFG